MLVFYAVLFRCAIASAFSYFYTPCPEKKRPRCFFVISPTKLGRFWWNSVHRFLNKFATKWCKGFLPNLNNVFTLPCETRNAHCARTTIELLRKETRELTPPQLCAPTSSDFESIDNSMWEILQEKMCITRITDLEQWRREDVKAARSFPGH